VNYYLNFLNLVKALSAEDNHAALEAEAKLILDEIALSEYNQEPMTVSDVMSLTHIASSATLHRKLSDLLNGGHIEFIFKDNNRRTKYVHLTASSTSYYKQLSSLFKKAKA
jgi:DNA-binding MarR family transcriptional regulator